MFHLIGKTPKDTRIVIIPNAKDYYSNRVRKLKANEAIDYFKSLNVRHIDIVDLQNFNISDTTRLAAKLRQYDLIWVSGGNTFCLRYEMRRSGFEKVINQVLASGVVYGGESAGALVAGNSLKGVEFADPPEFAEEIIWGGLDLIPHFVLPHVGNTDYAEAMEKAKTVHKSDSTMITLTDSQALVINEEKSEIIDSGSLGE